MKKLRTLATFIAGLWCCLAVNAYDFTGRDNLGRSIYYNIVSSTDKTVSVGYNDDRDEHAGYIAELTIPETVTYNNTTYTVVEIGSLGGSWLSGSPLLTSVVIPQSVKTIAAGAFSGYYSLQTVAIKGNGIKAIADRAFANCTELSSFTIEATTAPSIGNNAFLNVPKSCVLNYPEGCYESYAGWSSYFEVSIPDFSINGIFYEVTSTSSRTVAVTFQGDGEYTGDVVIPETVSYGGKTFTVTTIGLSAFSGCENLTSVTLPSTITKLDEYAFNYCTSLKSVNLPEGLTTIVSRAFRICHSLTSIEIPASVETIGESAFYECKALQSISFKGNASIGSGAFSYCTALTKVSVDDIADWCQMGFTDYSANPLYYAGNLYVGDALLTELTVPSEVTAISNYAFDGYEKLTSVDFGEGVKTIGSYAFRNCSGLTSLTIPANVTSIENNAFYGCTNVGEIVIADAEEPLTFGYNNDGSTTSGMFSTCYLKKPVYIGRNLSYDTSREGACSPFNLAGWYNTVESVTFGELVTEIPAYLLYNTGIYISDIYFQFRSNPTIDTNAFAPNQEIHLALNDAESTDFNAENENTFASAEYNRSLEKGKFGTIMLPFAPNDDNYIFFELTSAEGNVLTFYEVEEPKANTPYLFTLREEAEEVGTIKGGQTTIMADIVESAANDWQMVGSFTNQTIVASEDEDKYYYAYTSSDNKIHQVTNTLTVKPYRAYFTTSSTNNMQLAVRTRGGEETLIDASEVDGLCPEVYYDLSGRRVDNPTKGVYIVNGKKVVL